MLAAGAAHAAAEAPVPALAPDAVEGYVAPLSDEQARALLIQALKEQAQSAATAPSPEAETLASFQLHLRTLAISFGERIGALAAAVDEAPAQGAIVLRNLTDRQGWPAVGYALLMLAVMVAVGAMAAWALASATRAIGATKARGPAASLALALVARLAQGAVGVIAAYTASFALFQRFDPLRELAASLLLVAAAAWVAGSLARVVLDARWRAAERAEAEAGTSSRDAMLVAGAAALAFVGRDLLIILGLAEPLVRVFVLVAGTFAFALFGVAVTRRSVRGRRLVTAARMAVPLLWLVWAVDVVLGHDADGASAALAALVAAAGLVAGALLDAFERAATGQAVPAGAGIAATQWTRAVATIRSVVLAGAVIATVVLALDAVGLGLVTAAASEHGSAVVDALVEVGVTLALAYAAWQGLRFALDRHLKPLGAPGEAVAPSSRLRTLLPLIRNFALIVLVVLTALIVLSSIGLDIGPLLAGAGVVGLAIGFGAQTLVRDIVSGIFFLIDDAFRVGEYVEVGSLRGTVEGMSLRSLKLRHHRGHLHTIPFGELASLTNYSRDWVIMKLELNLTYDTDIEMVRKLLKQIGREMMDDPELGPHILEPLKSQGITQMGDFSLIVRAKFMAKPGEQFVIRREAYRRIKEAFDANGIKFAYPTVTISQASPGAALSPEAVKEIAAAAGVTGAKPSAPGAADDR
ncbi:MAG: mechanosensitive ion channel family protein [Alphaproteobacteria bacterium]